MRLSVKIVIKQKKIAECSALQIEQIKERASVQAISPKYYQRINKYTAYLDSLAVLDNSVRALFECLVDLDELFHVLKSLAQQIHTAFLMIKLTVRIQYSICCILI